MSESVRNRQFKQPVIALLNSFAPSCYLLSKKEPWGTLDREGMKSACSPFSLYTVGTLDGWKGQKTFV
jgi:hypothetical protein